MPAPAPAAPPLTVRLDLQTLNQLDALRLRLRHPSRSDALRHLLQRGIDVVTAEIGEVGQ